MDPLSSRSSSSAQRPSRLDSILSLAWSGLFAASTMWYLRTPQEDAPLYAAGAGITAFTLHCWYSFHDIAHCFYPSHKPL